MMAAVLEGQGELFPSVTQRDIERTKFLLEHYTRMVAVMRDYEQYQVELQQTTIEGETARRVDASDLYADKTANANVLLQKQRWVYEKYREVTEHIRRAHTLILDSEAKDVIRYRYLEGHTYTETALHFEKQGIPETTLKRRLVEGISAMADSLKLWGALEEWKF